MFLNEVLELVKESNVLVMSVDNEGNVSLLDGQEFFGVEEEQNKIGKQLEEIFWNHASQVQGKLIVDSIMELPEGELRSHLSYISSLMDKEGLPVDCFRVGEIPEYGEYSFELASKKCGEMYFEFSANEKKGDLVPMWYASEDCYQRPADSIIDSIVKNGLFNI